MLQPGELRLRFGQRGLRLQPLASADCSAARACAAWASSFSVFTRAST